MLDKLDPELLVDQDTTPEWLRQRYLITQEKATWEDFSFEERTCKGFLLPYLTGIESGFAGRWDYWLNTLLNDDLLDGPIPYVDFCGGADPAVLKNFHKCLRKFTNRGVGLADFLGWICWGFGEGEQRPQVAPEVNEYWYRTFNLGPMLQSPHDYLGDLLQESKSGYWNNPNAFFATPHNICEMMTKINFTDNQDYRTKSVLDPCVGTGRMLLHASNYSLFLYGQDVDLLCVQACKINAYLYMPWVVRPGLKHLKPKPAPEIKQFTKTDRVEMIKTGVERTTPTNIKPQQLTLFD